VGGKGALLINPYDTAQVAESIARALTMPSDARQALHNHALARAESCTAANWATTILNELRGPIARASRSLPTLPAEPGAVAAAAPAGASAAAKVTGVEASAEPPAASNAAAALTAALRVPAAPLASVTSSSSFPSSSLPSSSSRRQSALWSNFERFVVPGRKPALFLSINTLALSADTDGSGGGDTPAGSRLSTLTAAALKALASANLPAAVTCRQPLAEARVALGGAGAGIWVCASQGFEIEGPLADRGVAGPEASGEGSQVAYRAGDSYREVVAGAAAALMELLAGIEGAEVSTHTRHAETRRRHPQSPTSIATPPSPRTTRFFGKRDISKHEGL
jgi:hypothetical protein